MARVQTGRPAAGRIYLYIYYGGGEIVAVSFSPIANDNKQWLGIAEREMAVIVFPRLEFFSFRRPALSAPIHRQR